MGQTLVCDHCGWTGDAADLTPHPRLGDGLCPDCWYEGWETRPRERLGGLMEAIAPPDPNPRTKKLLIDYSDEEFEIAERTAHFKLAHETAPVFVPTDTRAGRQRGFDFMREEFKVQPRRRS